MATLFVFFFTICSSGFVAYSQGVAGGDSMPCIPKLLPCKAYLKAVQSPPASCCVPLNQIVTGESQCLCAVFNNEDILRSFNVTQDDALNLAKSCGSNADKSLCEEAAAPPSGSISTPPAPLPSPSTDGSAPSPSPMENAAIAIYHAGGSLWLAAILSFPVLAF